MFPLKSIVHAGMLQIVDSMLEQATSNKAFDANIPLLDISMKSVIAQSAVFSNALYEFFVIVEPFENRPSKSLLLSG